jgi:hypothetical protein
MTLRPGKEFKVQIGKQVPEFTLWSKKKTMHEDEATKHEGSKREKGEQTSEEKEMKEKEMVHMEKPSGEEAQPSTTTTTTTSQEKEATTTASTSPPSTSKSSDSHGEKMFEVNEVFQGKTKVHYIFMFFFRENADFEDREDMWTIRDMWDDLQKIGNGLTVYGFSTGSRMDKIQLMRRKLKLPFEIFPDNNYDALRHFMPVGGTAKWIGALAPAFGAKINCGVLVLGDKTVARVYPDGWSAERLLHDMREVDQRIAEGRPLVDEPPHKEESHPATSEKDINNNNTNVAPAEGTTTEKPAKSEKKKKEKEKDKKRDKEQAAVSEGAQGEEKPATTSAEEEGAKEKEKEGAKEAPKKKERTKSIWNTLRKRTSPRSDSTPAPISEDTVPPSASMTSTTTSDSSGVTVTDSNVNTTNATTTTSEVGTGIAPSDSGVTMTTTTATEPTVQSTTTQQ